MLGLVNIDAFVCLFGFVVVVVVVVLFCFVLFVLFCFCLFVFLRKFASVCALFFKTI